MRPKRSFRSTSMLLLLVPSLALGAEEDLQKFSIDSTITYEYRRPRGVPFITNLFADFGLVYSNTVDRKQLPWMLGIAGATLVSLHYDEEILRGAQWFGKSVGIGDGSTRTFFMGGFSADVPTDVGSSLYFLGNGWLHVSTALAFLGAGYLGNDYRAWSTSYALFEGLLAVGIATQFLKHLTGRESPFLRTEPRGAWRWFPDPVDYFHHVPKYDAFPSGHLATAMLTVTVISENYPEYGFIKPVGYSLMALLAFQMLNNGVHWLSDYPLALAIGNVFAKSAVSHYRKVTQSIAGFDEERRHEPAMFFFTPLLADRSAGVAATLLF